MKVVTLGVSDGWEGGKGRLSMGGTLPKALPDLILCPGHLQLVLTWLAGAEGGDAIQALRHMGSMGTCPWEMPPEICRSVLREMPKGVQPWCWDKLSDQGCGMWHCPLCSLGSRCWSLECPLFQSCGMGHEEGDSPVGPVVSPAHTHPLG